MDEAHTGSMGEGVWEIERPMPLLAVKCWPLFEVKAGTVNDQQSTDNICFIIPFRFCFVTCSSCCDISRPLY